MLRRHGLTDAQWELIRDLSPGKASDPGRTSADNRLFVDAIRYLAKTGVAWADRPARYGKPNRLWQRDNLPAEELLGGFTRRSVGHVAADADDAIQERVRRLGAKACIRPNPTRKARKRYDRSRYRHRNVIERLFGGRKRFRRVATRYEKKAANFAGFVWLAAFLVNN
jgi:putative transposase